MLVYALEWINKNNDYIKNCDGINIITDSQNCLNILSQKHKPSDDIIIQLYKLADKQLIEINKLQLPKGFINFYWVHSHSDSNLNIKVDLYAKVAASTVRSCFIKRRAVKQRCIKIKKHF
jgi:ribonuclease HI